MLLHVPMSEINDGNIQSLHKCAGMEPVSLDLSVIVLASYRTTCMYGPLSLGMSVVVSQNTGPRDSPHRRGSESGAGPLE